MCAAWARGPGAWLAVSVSAHQLVSDDFPEQVSGVLDRCGIPPAALHLEITEAYLVDDVLAPDVLAGLRLLGVQLSIDDFGSGWSSLSRLVTMPVSTVKVDRRSARTPGPGQTEAMRLVTFAVVVVLVLSACGGAPAGSTSASAAQASSAMPVPTAGQADTAPTEGFFPDVVAATATRSADGTWQFTATVSSPYDSPSRFADAWRVLAPDGTVLGVRELTHDHAAEQPFTRSLMGVDVPPGVERVTVEGRDQVNGWGGATVEVALQP